MKNLQQYEKLFSRDFSLPSVEAWIRGESTNPKEWTEQEQPFLPYIIAEYADDTVSFYYNFQGLDWACDLLIRLAREDKNFLKKIERGVLEKLTYIRPIYEKEKAIPLPTLKRFLREYEEGFPAFEAMWLYCEMDQAKLEGLNLQNIQKLRTATDKLCGGTDAVIRKSLTKIYPKLDYLSSFLRTEEILSERIPSKKILEERSNGYFFGKNQLFVGISKSTVAKTLNIHFKKDSVKKTAQLKGNIAYQGIVKGYVRRVMGHRQIGQMQEGEILVSPMTIPDFLPAMKKAAAFVTDEGGILCHAAIVARELKKPCIVGTQFATKIFKNGDFVEVDAYKGVVKFLK